MYENEIKKQTELKNKNIADVMNAEKKMADPWKNGLVILEGTRINRKTSFVKFMKRNNNTQRDYNNSH